MYVPKIKRLNSPLSLRVFATPYTETQKQDSNMKHEATTWRLYGNTSSEPEKDRAPATLAIHAAALRRSRKDI
jgi:hypothetical protein